MAAAEKDKDKNGCVRYYEDRTIVVGRCVGGCCRNRFLGYLQFPLSHLFIKCFEVDAKVNKQKARNANGDYERTVNNT